MEIDFSEIQSQVLAGKFSRLPWYADFYCRMLEKFVIKRLADAPPKQLELELIL